MKCQVPGGAFYVWPNVTEACRRIGAADSEEFRKRLLHEAGVAVLADIHFGTRVPGEGQHVRFSYAASKQAIEAGVQRMADFIRKNTKKGRMTYLEALGDGRRRHRARRQVSPRRRSASTGRLVLNQPAGPPRSGRVARRRVPPRGAGRDRAPLRADRRWSASTAGATRPKDVTFLRFCFRGTLAGTVERPPGQGNRRAALAHAGGAPAAQSGAPLAAGAEVRRRLPRRARTSRSTSSRREFA